jgi:hypothetical protein
VERSGTGNSSEARQERPEPFYMSIFCRPSAS